MMPMFAMAEFSTSLPPVVNTLREHSLLSAKTATPSVLTKGNAFSFVQAFTMATMTAETLRRPLIYTLTRTIGQRSTYLHSFHKLRGLNDNMYNYIGPDDALLSVRRASLGATQIVRYPDDDYDRMWYPSYGIGLTELTSEATSVDVGTAKDKPPAAVLQNATT
ncbi:hypothetical protein TIFTF001_013374 [Ficus carica]|uniref:Malectin-like domain-containing protein n=1 Tax=Ficus carica TaxID=3494 RepID=A0AA88D5Z5_FICCA|nr:hypothetical protein TIFTF001_013374 [Ficus carica]